MRSSSCPVPQVFAPTWRETPHDRRVQQVLDSWLGTPYMLGSAVKLRGVDCIRFVTSVFDELRGYQTADYERLPPDLALHQPESARAALRTILRLYDPIEEWDGAHVEAGDAFVVARFGGGPGHAMIAGARQSTLYHATSEGVARSGLWFEGPFTVHRYGRKEEWLR